jgi:hypothetical protein
VQKKAETMEQVRFGFILLTRDGLRNNSKQMENNLWLMIRLQKLAAGAAKCLGLVNTGRIFHSV